eukprot:TRINITY_DN1465_c0_g1_i5.p1 TRINITY_DN1465_c0_g1~~TRINITY_DN1465_c0_g1_i5.p1  ORF type:complete len:356 (+),score=45.70 TRINITY_DN1465_c0_g1_i5:262-1329(+)
MKHSKCSLSVLRYCCYALGNLVTSISDDSSGSFRRFVESEQIIPFLFAYLRNNLDDWQLAQRVCFAIGNVVFICDFESLVLACEGIEIVLECMARYPYQAQMNTDAVFFLKNMAYGEAGREVILSNNGISHTLKALLINGTHAELAELSFNLFFDLSFSGGTEELTRQPHAFKILMDTLKQHINEPAVLRECVRTLSRLYIYSTTETRVALIKEGLIDSLVPLLDLNIPHFVRQLEINFFRIHQKLVSFQSAPNSKVPLLVELSARKVFETMRAYESHSYIPQDIKNILSSCERCHLCKKAYWNHSYHIVSPIRFPKFHFSLPVYWSLCSEGCLNKVKDRKDLLNSDRFVNFSHQ